MNFFERQNQARRKTELLLFYFVPAVILIIAAGYCAVTLLFSVFGYLHGAQFPTMSRHGMYHVWHGHLELLLWVSGGTLLIILFGCVSKMSELADGGPALANSMDARWIQPGTTDPDEQRLRDVVEEMAIAAGLPAPQLFVLPRSRSINTLVAGRSPQDAAVGITEGGLKLLSRDEMQAVVAHQFSNILNGDMRLNFWLIGVLNGILSIYTLGESMTEVFDEDSNVRGAGGLALTVMVAGWLMMAVGGIGYYMACLIRSAVCRERLFLADAATVQFTRHPASLVGSLKKIGGLESGSRIFGVSVERAGHLFFANVSTDFTLNCMSTHPPLQERIRALDPFFDGVFPKVEGLPVPPAPPMSGPGFGLRRRARIAAGDALAHRMPTLQHVTLAASLCASFSDVLKAAARQPFDACALVFAMLLSADAAEREQQLNEITPMIDSALLRETLSLFPHTDALSSAQKLALANIAVPALRQMATGQFDEFEKAVRQLIESDGKVSLFEYTLQRVLRRNIESCFRPKRPVSVQYYGIAGLAKECAVLLSAMARNGSDSEVEIQKAFETGAATLDLPQDIQLLPDSECNLPQIDSALDKFMTASMPVRNLLLRACSFAAATDGLLEEHEAELLRAIADSLECPLPPILPAENTGSAAR